MKNDSGERSRGSMALLFVISMDNHKILSSVVVVTEPLSLLMFLTSVNVDGRCINSFNIKHI